MRRSSARRSFDNGEDPTQTLSRIKSMIEHYSDAAAARQENTAVVSDRLDNLAKLIAPHLPGSFDEIRESMGQSFGASILSKLERASDAHAAIEARTTLGKTLLVVR